jgi:hypothetical protein
MRIRWKKKKSRKTVASGSSAGREAQLYEEYSEHRRPTMQRAAGLVRFRNVYAHSCEHQGCTAVVIGQRTGLQDWIVWNLKDKYRQAGFMLGSPGNGVDNACRFRPTREKEPEVPAGFIASAAGQG